MRELQRFVEEPRACGYLEDRLASLDHRVLLDVEPKELEGLLERGWRRFGPVSFRPACVACSACVSVRVPVASFRPSRSQRRAAARMLAFRLEVGRPTVDARRLALHAAWHAIREKRRGWRENRIDGRDYFMQLGFPQDAALELSWWDGRRLVAIGIADATPRAVSAVYAFHDPAIARCSPGTANVLACIDLARQRGARHVYLGYSVDGCSSLAYKRTFRPHEVLVGWPADDDRPAWVPGEQGTSSAQRGRSEARRPPSPTTTDATLAR